MGIDIFLIKHLKIVTTVEFKKNVAYTNIFDIIIFKSSYKL